MRRILGSSLLAGALAMLAVPSVAQAAPPTPTDQVTAVTVTPTIEPTPVAGTDGRVHLVYELLMVNYAPDPATVASVEALDAAHPSRVLQTLRGAAVASHFKISQLATPITGPAVIAAGDQAIVWMDASVPLGSPVPEEIIHKIRITFAQPQAGGLIPDDVTVEVGHAPASHLPTPVIESPLAGPRWFDANGCCEEVTAHRGAVNPLDGNTNFPERTAIDWLQLDEHGRLFEGPATSISSYAYYGTPVHAVADGEIVAVVDGLPNQVPTQEPPLGQLPLKDFAGNHIIEKFVYEHHTFYAGYAHLKPGSASGHVHVGQHVVAGQQIGDLGNSGNSGAPHLHFQVMDKPSFLSAQGLPYEFDRFKLVARGLGDASVDAALNCDVVPFQHGFRPQWLDCRLPLYTDLLDFPPAHVAPPAHAHPPVRHVRPPMRHAVRPTPHPASK